MTFFWKSNTLATLATLLLSAISCGGGASGSGTGGVGGGGGGGGGNQLHISLLSPSMVMSDIAIGGVNITGTGFTPQSQVLMDGSPVLESVDSGSQHIEGSFNGPSIGVHQISVQNGSQVSNSLPFTFYDPVPAPGPLFDAIPGYYAGPEVDADFVVLGDFNGDGRDDVIIAQPGTPNLALLLGQSDGSLSAPQYLSNMSATVAGDVDGNGTVDLIGLVSSGPQLENCAVYLNDGRANFTPAEKLRTDGTYPNFSN